MSWAFYPKHATSAANGQRPSRGAARDLQPEALRYELWLGTKSAGEIGYTREEDGTVELGRRFARS